MASTAASADLSKLRISRDNGEPSSSNPPNRLRPVWIALVVLALVVGGYLIYSKSGSSTLEVDTTTVARMFPSQAGSLLTATGYVVARQKAAIASKGTGRLVSLNVEEGDQVKKDQIIGRLESADVEAALAQARANVNVAISAKDQAQAELEDAKLHFDRTTKLVAQKTVSTQELDIANARYKRAVAAVASAESGIKAAEANAAAMAVQLENTYIRAPFDGTILNKNADVGEIVAPFAASASSRAAVVTLADMNSLEVQADVSESNLERIVVGRPCEIVLDAIPETRYRGVVHKIVPTVDRAKATVMTKIRFTEFDARVLPEMSAKVMFLKDSTMAADTNASPVLVVRRDAVVSREGKDVAFVVHGERADLVPVTLGQSMGTLVEIRAGLAVNDIVVSHPDDKLSTGAHVISKTK